LPDFEDVLAEEKALDYALAFPDFTTALAFFIDWKQLRYAARLVLERSAESTATFISFSIRLPNPSKASTRSRPLSSGEP
jgi:hypothetical protein